MTTRITVGFLFCLALAACNAGTTGNSVTSNTPMSAPSGVTSSNGGGMREMGNIPSVSSGTNGATIGNVPNKAGNSY